ncbi:MAG: hypothetical protein QOF58_1434 [Pseudonocardiales bacterium]|nr:hypothetical protein [Pseudonocardiales bacterium]
MGWVETTAEGTEILHDWMFVGPAEGQDVELEGAALDWWLLNVRAPLRTACTCGWISSVPGPDMPEIALPYPATDDGPKTAVGYTAARSFIAQLPWWHVGEVNWPADVRAWRAYQLDTWKNHISQVFAGTHADDTTRAVPRAVAELLDDVEKPDYGGLVALRRLTEVEEAVNDARRLAVAAARRQGATWIDIARLLGLGDPDLARLMYSGAATEQSRP